MGHGKRDDMIVHEDEPYNAEPAPSALANRWLTPLDAFYSRNHGSVPSVDSRTWRLQVDGLVQDRLDLSLQQLRDRFDEQTLVATLQCAGNRRKGFLEFRDIPGEAPWGATAISTAEWTGVSLADVLTQAGLRPEAAHIEFLAPDIAQGATPPQPYGSSIPVHKATAAEVLLAWAMNGEPLPAVHGAPVRVVVPGYIGARSVKWVQRIRALAQTSDNYFQAVAYRLPTPGADHGGTVPDPGIALGAVPVNSDILSPEDGKSVPVGPTTVTGFAFGGEDGITRVEVSVDDGRNWHQARVEDELSRWAWCSWQITVDVPAGAVRILARAWTSAGLTQPESAEELWNPKGYLNNSWARVHLTGVLD